MRVADFFCRKVTAVDVGATAAEAAAAMVAARSQVCLVVANGRPAGIVTASLLSEIPVRQRATVPVASVMRKVPLASLNDELPAVLKVLDEERLQAAAVVDGDQLVGTLSLEDIARGLQLRELAGGHA